MESTRQKIKTGNIINRLNKHIEGEVEMSSTQIAAAKTLLAKVLPDLQATQVTQESTVNYVARMPDVSQTAEEWQSKHSPTIQ